MKRRRSNGGDDSDGGSARRPRESDGEGPTDPTIGKQTSHIRNKQRRSEVYGKLKHKQKVEKKKERLKREREDERARELGEKTIENTREADVTVVEAGDAEVEADEAGDEFAAHFAGAREPNVLLTTSRHPSKVMFDLLGDLLTVLPRGAYYARRGYEVKDIVKHAAARGYSDVAVLHEDAKEVNGLLLVHLPDGPTAHFRLSSLVLSRDIKGHGKPTGHKPELILNNFTTRLGHRVGRLFASLFCVDPTFRGRRAVTLHNQRDFIFFRHHRYIFEKGEAPPPPGAPRGKKAPPPEERITARLQECGPRFTLRLQSLQRGTFDSKFGEYEWVRSTQKAQADTSRRRFYL